MRGLQRQNVICACEMCRGRGRGLGWAVRQCDYSCTGPLLFTRDPPNARWQLKHLPPGTLHPPCAANTNQTKPRANAKTKLTKSLGFTTRYANEPGYI